MPLNLVLKACPDILLYANIPITMWDHLVTTANHVRSMMGISPTAWADAQAAREPPVAAVTLAGILQRFSSNHSAGGYLRNLTRRAEAGEFSPGQMIMALLAGARTES